MISGTDADAEGNTGVEVLNRILQQYMNPPGEGKRSIPTAKHFSGKAIR